MKLFYHSVIESVLVDGIVIWGGSCTDRDWKLINGVIKSARKIIGLPLGCCGDLYGERVRKFASKITADPSHLLHACYQRLPSGRRFRAHRCRTERLRRSFVPKSICLANRT